MNWKTILALAVLVSPLSWCLAVDEADRRASNLEVEIACINAGGTYGGTWGKSYCQPKEPRP